MLAKQSFHAMSTERGLFAVAKAYNTFLRTSEADKT